MTTLSHSEKEHIMADIPFCDKTRISVEGVKIWG